MHVDHQYARFALPVLALAAGPCLAGGPQPFLERGIARGINYPVQIGAFQLGSGLGMFDMDGDGDPDVIAIGAFDGRVGLYENDGTGHFSDRTNDDGGASRFAKHTDYSGVSAADYDADGDLDIYLSRYGAPNILYRNDGDWDFVDVSAASGLDDVGHSLATVWADCNADGWLDLYVSNRTFTNEDPTENGFYENNGDGTFTEKAVAAGIQRAGDPTLVASFFDYNFDSKPDLYLGTDKGAFGSFTNHLFENQGGSFLNVTAATGTEANVDCMGIALGDIDRNGFFDMFLTNIPTGHVLLTGNADGTFTDRSAASGAQEFEIGWGTAFFDFDNDTWEDLYLVQTGASNAFYRNPGSLPLENIGLAMNVATTGSSYCMSTADIDNDGDIDLLVAKLGDRVQLYINNEGSTRNWAKFDVVGQGANTFGIGAQIRVDTGQALAPQIREVRAGHNYKAMDPTTVHFGLGSATLLSTTTIVWPNTGDTRVLSGYPVNRTWTAYPGERIGDLDGDGDVDGADIDLVFDRHVTANARAAEAIEPGIEMLDADGDADFDADDVLLIGTPCPSDVAAPVGVLDLVDINAFIGAFLSQSPLADLTGEGIYDLADLGLFVAGFNGGCP